MRLMIVDDQASTREMIRNFLDLPGITFCECATGDEAVARARVFKPDWVTMDVHLPGRNGFQTTVALHTECPSSRVMIVTGDNQPHFRKLAREAGALGLLGKENLAALRLMLLHEMNYSKELPSAFERPSPVAS